MPLLPGQSPEMLDRLRNMDLPASFADTALGNLENNTSQVTLNGQPYNVIRPGELYPGVWGWDAAFHAIGLAYGSGERGLEELEISALGQTEDGRIPQILFYDAELANRTYYPGPNMWECESANGLPISGLSQPPVYGFALEKILEIDPAAEQNEDKVRELFNVAYNYQKWWYEERDPEGTGLVVSIHPWETGRDNPIEWDPIFKRIRATDEFQDMPFDPAVRKDIRIDEHGNNNAKHRPSDEAYKMFTHLLHKVKDNGYSIKDADGEYRKDFPFAVQDVTINSMLQASNEALIRLSERYGTPEQQRELRRWGTQTRESFNHLWNDEAGAFQSRDTTTGKLTETSNGSFLALATSVPSEYQAARMAHLLDDWKHKHGVKYHICSSPPDHADFNTERYWRGPIWTIVNYVAAEGLLMQGARFENPAILDKGLEVTLDSLELVQMDGGAFHEYHNPVTGKGCGAKSFGFTSVAFLDLTSKLTHYKTALEAAGEKPGGTTVG